MCELLQVMNTEKVRDGRHPQVTGLQKEPAKQPKKVNTTLNTNDKMMESFSLAR